MAALKVTLTELMDRFGGHRALARELRVERTTVATWHLRGVPNGQKFRILLAAKKLGIQLEIEELAEMKVGG
jgi:hypothetical protein